MRPLSIKLMDWFHHPVQLGSVHRRDGGGGLRRRTVRLPERLHLSLGIGQPPDRGQSSFSGGDE
jgi:hypothetical protein